MKFASCLALIALLISAVPARADVRDFLGRPVAANRVELAGIQSLDPAVLQLIETRVGEPLSMERVRETIDHLIGLGRFEDIRVFAEVATSPPEAVTLRWVLAPVQRIDRIEIAGNAAFTPEELRDAIVDRVGNMPGSSRLAEIVSVVHTYYEERGYQRPEIVPRFSPGRAPELVTLSLAIAPGVRTTIGVVTIMGDGTQSPETVLARLGIGRGRPYDRVAIDTRLEAFEEELRSQGYYEATAEATARFNDDGVTADVTVTIERGPRVRVVFAGDPLPENRRDTLVPIRQERSVDLDLLEDASRNIETFLRQQGYRTAQARYTRESKAGEMVLTFTVTRGPLHRLATLDLEGATALPREKLAPLLQLKPGEAFVDSRVAAVATAITEVYRVEGFARAAVKAETTTVPQSSETSRAAPDQTAVAVRLIVSEGPRTIVGAVDIDGAQELPEAQLRPLLSLTSARPYYRPLLDADRNAIEQLYRDEGFQNIRVEGTTVPNADGTRVDVRWEIREGARTIVDHVLVSGNFHTSAELIRREVALQPGRPLGDTAIIESQRRLAALGLFRRVRIIELPHGASTTRDVLIEVEEADPTSVSVGGGVEASRRLRRVNDQAVDQIELAPRGFFEITRRNLWGKNRSVSAFTRISFRPRDPAVDSTDPTDEGGYGFNEYRIFGAFREPRPFNRPGDLQITGFLEQAKRTSFNFSRRGIRAEYGRRIGERLTISGRYAFDRTRLFDEQIQPEDRLLIDRVFPQVRLSTFTGSVLHDSRNDVLDPERGAVIGADGTIAARRAGSEVGFVRSFLQAFGYRRIPGAARLILAAGMRFGLAVGFERLVERFVTADPSGNPIVDVVDDVPASERFFAGGDTTVRGFVLDRLGTDDTLNDQGFPTGGSGLVVMNVEVRTPYWKGLGGVGFFDAGNVFRRATDVSLTKLRPASGVGVRYRSPLGPLRVDFGFNLDRQFLRSGVKERGMVFHISLGQAF
jgi:outer membrane protein assembly complex protein YaeT